MESLVGPLSGQLLAKALVAEGPNKLLLTERPVSAPGHSEVLIRVAAASICHTDFVTMAGEHSAARFPSVLGHEFSGIVERCGGGVEHLKPGDRVTAMGFAVCGICPACRHGKDVACRRISAIPFQIDGAFQETITVPASMVFRISDKLSLEEAALTEPAANGYSAVERAGIRPGETVVIIGPGPIGLLAVQAARLKDPGLLITLGTRDERLQLASKFGATHTINVRECDPATAIRTATDGEGVDVVLFCGGGEDTWDMALSVLAPFGRLVVEALPDSYSSRWKVPVFDFTAKQIDILGVCGFNVSQFATALALMESGKIDVASLITHTFSLEDYADAFETVKSRRNGAIKAIFRM